MPHCPFWIGQKHRVGHNLFVLDKAEARAKERIPIIHL